MHWYSHGRLPGKSTSMMAFARAWKLAAALCLLTTSACTSGQCPSTDLATRTIHVAGVALEVEIAETPSQRACGLSLRTNLDINKGMLFVYRDDQILEFWMKDTWIPLTVAFLDAHGRITDLVDLDPGNPEERIRSSRPARFALETHRGWFRANDLKRGDIVDLGAD